MKLLFVILSAVSVSVGISASASQLSQLGHLDLEMSSNEYREALSLHVNSFGIELEEADGLDEVIRVGVRNLDWLKHINSKRGKAEKISFSSKETQRGIPIDKPSKYNPDLIQEKYDNILKELPEGMKKVVVDGEDFTDDPPIAEADYIVWGRKLSRAYQTAARWRLLSPYIPILRGRRANDVRGYYFLSKVENLADKLTHWDSLTDTEQMELASHLQGMCYNSTRNSVRCRNSLNEAEEKSEVKDYYDRYVGAARRLYNSFFQIQNSRGDINWTGANDAVAYFPFRNPGSAEVMEFLKLNIEDEWMWEGWNLQIRFERDAATYIRFVAGATPNVNGLGGNRITLDANQPLDEYNVQWTIRHEFGHVLGFPDCYVEFYDDDEAAMINYQIDVENLMCSRQGKLLETHFDEMKRAYYRDGKGKAFANIL